jgi:tRNA-intron endonuclease
MPVIRVEASEDHHLIVWSIKDSRKLYNDGFYGNPLGIVKPKEDFEAPLVLDIIEGTYLVEKGVIGVYSGDTMLELGKLKELGGARMEDFGNKYVVYRDLRERGYVVTPGIKYGCDFAVYEEGPGIDHAPYIVQIADSGSRLTALDVVKSGRLATTVRKSFILAVVGEDDVKYLEFNWWKA